MRATGRSRSRSLIEEELSATRETKTIELKKDVLAMANSGGSPDTAILQGAARHWIIHSREPDRCCGEAYRGNWDLLEPARLPRPPQINHSAALSRVASATSAPARASVAPDILSAVEIRPPSTTLCNLMI